jgi:hypothetical protein
MPALPAVPKVVRADYHFSLGGDTNAMWRTFWQYSGSLNNADSLLWTASVFNAWHVASGWQSISSNDITLTKCETTDLSSSSAPQSVTTGATVGSRSVVPVTAGAAAVVSFKMARRYRGGHPRIYIPGLGYDYIATAQQWSSGALANIAAAFNAWALAVQAAATSGMGTTIQVNVSYFSGFTNVTFPSGRIRPVPKLRVGGPVVDVLTNAFVNPNVASQRRRNQQP